MTKIIHPMAGVITMLTTVALLASTILSETFGDSTTIVFVKMMNLWGFLVLIPALIIIGGSGFVLAKGQNYGAISAKSKRMKIIVINGFLVLFPCALILALTSEPNDLGTSFYAVQAVELIASLINLFLLGLNMRDGMSLTQWKRKDFLSPKPAFSSNLVFKAKLAKDSMAFHLKKPSTFKYSPGQAIYVTLPKPAESDNKGYVRTFSITSEPTDTDLIIATKISDSSFKQSLINLPPEAQISIEGPYGDFALHEDQIRPAVFLAGGIGITPFLSIISDASKRGLLHKLFLFYSNRSPEETAFRSELIELEKQNSRFKLIETITDTEYSSWKGEKGYINQEMILKHIKDDILKPIYYVAGSPAMVASMTSLLKSLGVKSEDVCASSFLGY